MESFSNKRQFTQRPEAVPDLQIREGGAGRFFLKKFSALRALVWSKNKGRAGPPAPPLDPPLTAMTTTAITSKKANGLRSPSSWCIKGTDQQLSRRDLAVRLTYHDQPLCTCITHFGTSIFRPRTT